MKPQPNTQKKKSRRSAHRRGRPSVATIVILACVAVVAGLVGLSIYNTLNDQAEAAKPIEGVTAYPGQAQTHVDTPVTYAQTPPVGGPHSSAWQNCGVYTQAIASENGVHSLEHGAVWITYQSGLSADEVLALQTLTRQSSYRLLSPYPGLSTRIVVSAWGYQLKVDQVDDPRLLSFIRKYERSPLGPEPGAPRTGGIGQPG